MACRDNLTAESPEDVFELKPLEWCTGIYRRRFDRPTNSYIRNHQMAEHTALALPLPTVNRKGGSRNRFEDDPLPPPPQIQSQLPDFVMCAPNKCGNHIRPGEDPDATVDCYKCNVTSAIRFMHPLPCGHYLCCKDVEKVAVEAFSRIHDFDIGRGLWMSRLELSRMQENMKQLIEDKADDSTRREQQRIIDYYLVFLESQVGLTCCYKDTKIIEHMNCLEPHVARGLWMVRMYLSADPNVPILHCGWPDCKNYIPHQYTWIDQGIDGVYGQRWHCVVCEGNSKLQSHYRLQPAR